MLVDFSVSAPLLSKILLWYYNFGYHESLNARAPTIVFPWTILDSIRRVCSNTICFLGVKSECLSQFLTIYSGISVHVRTLRGSTSICGYFSLEIHAVIHSEQQALQTTQVQILKKVHNKRRRSTMRLGCDLFVGLFVACALLLIGVVNKHYFKFGADGLSNNCVGRNLRFRHLNQEHISSNNTRPPIRVSLHPSLERVADSRKSDFVNDELETPSNDEEENVAPVETPSTDEEETVAPDETTVENPVEASNTTVATENSDNSAASFQSNQSDDSTSPIFIVLVILSLLLVISLFALLLVTPWEKSAKEESSEDLGGDEFVGPPVSKIHESSTPGASILRTANLPVSLCGSYAVHVCGYFLICNFPLFLSK